MNLPEVKYFYEQKIVSSCSTMLEEGDEGMATRERALSGMRCNADSQISSMKNHEVRLEQDVSINLNFLAAVRLQSPKTLCKHEWSASDVILILTGIYIRPGRP